MKEVHMEPTIKKLTSRKFLLAAATFVAAALEVFGVKTLSNLDPESIAAAATVLITWLGGEVYLDSKRINTEQQLALKSLQDQANAYIADLQAKLAAATPTPAPPAEG